MSNNLFRKSVSAGVRLQPSVCRHVNRCSVVVRKEVHLRKHVYLCSCVNGCGQERFAGMDQRAGKVVGSSSVSMHA